jgi:hypothetical protein
MSTPSTPTDLEYLTTAPSDLVTDAVAALINPSSNVVIGDLVTSIQPGGQVIITPTTAAYANPEWPYYGHAVATYSLVDLASVFEGIDLNLTISQLPARSGDVANLLNSIFDILLTPADVVDVPLPTILGGGSLFTLQASPNSLMWKGSVEMKLWPTSVATTDLVDWIINTNLGGLNPPEPTASFTIDNPVVTDGLTLAQLQQATQSQGSESL